MPFGNELHKIFFFEIFIEEYDEEGLISIGLTPRIFPLNKLPGGTNKCTGAYGYQSDGSMMFNKSVYKKHKQLEIGSYIGCGFNTVRRTIFFTFNREVVRKLISF